MTIKEQILDIKNEMEKTGKDTNKIIIASKLMQLQGTIQDGKQEIPLEVFEAMDNDMRFIALTGFVALNLASLQKDGLI